MSILPKARSRSSSTASTTIGMVPSRTSSLHNLSNKGRAISKSKRVASNHHHGGAGGHHHNNNSTGNRMASRGDLFGGDGSADLEDAIHFDENKHTILSNFEEWIKLSTDNKITSKNSWQIALIDYFKDLNVIKDGENINFQRASATLDGCVKIYSSRVESAATETGKLLSGLAKKKEEGNHEEDGEDGAGDEDEDGEEGNNVDENGVEIRKKRKMNRVMESTIVKFETIKVKKFDQELAIDPLFKKALSEFDEGGAKSLLLNTLSIDKSGRVIFDATTRGEEKEVVEEEAEQIKTKSVDDSIMEERVSKLSSFLFEENDIEKLSICPSLNELKLVLTDINKAKKVLGDVNNRFLDEEREERENGNSLVPSPYVPTFDEFDDFGDDNDLSNHFNESVVRSVLNMDDGEREIMEDDGDEEMVVKSGGILDRDLMAYFDTNMKSNWRGPEHWKVAQIKKSHQGQPQENNDGKSTTSTTTTRKSREKNATIINFFNINDEDEEEKLFETPKNILSTTIKPDQRELKKNKLPEDIQYNSSKLTNLFLKDRSVVQWTRGKSPNGSKSNENILTDENFFADQYVKREQEEAEAAEAEKSRIGNETGNPFYDDDDFGGDDFGGIDFNDALAVPSKLDESEDKKGTFSTQQLLSGGRKARPEYVNFSRIAKRVDVKLLKDNLWRSIKQEEQEEEEELSKDFAEVITSIGKMYPPEEKKDLSTSFCFICLLHLANEHGLDISTNDTNDNLKITGF
ncbi:condensin complex subunit 2 [[Candida] anglica]|uniref:Condensin complex subunit 2 n=1 Tax=[Candida] anglica TaxID=148631 RepID=A0ABP0EG97_9ASCO